MKMLKKHLTVLIVIYFTLPVIAQHRQGMAPTSKGPQNVVKYNLLGTIAYKNIPVYYERAIYGPIAISAGFGYKIPTKVGGAYGSAIKNIVEKVGGEADFGKVKGFSVTPELKFYFSEKGAPKGFYISPYFRYSRYRLSMSASGTNPTDSIFYSADVALQYESVGGGIQLGAQWLINDAFAIDWFFFGPGYMKHNLSVDVTSNVVSSAKWQEWETDFEDDVATEMAALPVVGGFLDNFEAEAKNNGFLASMPFRFPNWRFGVSLGYSF
ncbi:MAG: DUF3575 domain-containing protein [Flavobacteriales bacterium]|nr:DUF3575 domain-containing protein [Flavobacteriales bacterium]